MVVRLSQSWKISVSRLYASQVVTIIFGVIVALVILLRFWQPKTTWSFAHEPAGSFTLCTTKP